MSLRDKKMIDEQGRDMYFENDISEAVRELMDKCSSSFECTNKIDYDWLMDEIRRQFGEELT